jgi:hypothetical protein
MFALWAVAGMLAFLQQPRRQAMLARRSTFVALAAAAATLAAGWAWAQAARTPSPPGAKVYFISPADGAVIKGPVKVVMGLSGMGVAPAGVDIANTGHHHILVNAPANLKLDAALPADEVHRHFGLGQTEAQLTLPPGKHTLQLLLGDRSHVPHDPPVMSEKITITVLP